MKKKVRDDLDKKEKNIKLLSDELGRRMKLIEQLKNKNEQINKNIKDKIESKINEKEESSISETNTSNEISTSISTSENLQEPKEINNNAKTLKEKEEELSNLSEKNTNLTKYLTQKNNDIIGLQRENIMKKINKN